MRKQALQIVGFAGVVAAIQLVASLSGNVYHLTQLTMSAYYSLVVLGLCILTGYAGQISIGHAGFFAIAAVSRTTTYSAKAPPAPPKTSSPGSKRLTASPTASTTPAKSLPSRVSAGLPIPDISRMRYGEPRMKCQSSGFTPAARTLTSTWSGAGTGFSTAPTSSTSGEP